MAWCLIKHKNCLSGSVLSWAQGRLSFSLVNQFSGSGIEWESPLLHLRITDDRQTLKKLRNFGMKWNTQTIGLLVCWLWSYIRR
jgi:hypothetical protein